MVLAGSPRSVAGTVSAALIPELDYALWRRRRRRLVREELLDPEYEEWFGPAGASLGRLHVVVVPQEGEGFNSFRAGTRNFYFEAAQCLQELLGDTAVSTFDVTQGESPASWHVRLLQYLGDVGATHVLTHIEHDPGTGGGQFTWDTFWTFAAPRWKGVLLGVMFDSAYRGIRSAGKQLARISDRFVLVDICMPMNGALAWRRPEVGPVNMPVSRASMALTDERIAGLEPTCDVSFIGALYPYRVELIERLRAAGVTIAVNPHRPDETTDFASSRQDQPGWLDYMAGLRSSRMTVNFSQSSAGPVQQLKTRVIEATLAGTLLLTDDRDRTRLFWREGEEFVRFNGPSDLPGIVTGLLAEPDRLRDITLAGQRRARQLAPTSFWEGIDAGLARRRLPLILGGSHA